jgi:hypothetical protein
MKSKTAQLLAFLALLVVAFAVLASYSTSDAPATGHKAPVSHSITVPVTGHGVTSFPATEHADGRTYTCTETVSNGQAYVNDCNTAGS